MIGRLRSREVGCFSRHTRYLKFCILYHTILCILGLPFLKFYVEEIWSVTRISGNDTINVKILHFAYWLKLMTFIWVNKQKFCSDKMNRKQPKTTALAKQVWRNSAFGKVHINQPKPVTQLGCRYSAFGKTDVNWLIFNEVVMAVYGGWWTWSWSSSQSSSSSSSSSSC